MTFDYDIENEDGEPVERLRVEARFSPYVPAYTSGLPEDCYPAEGGELEELVVCLGNKDITRHVDDLFGPDTYRNIKQYAEDNYDPKKERRHDLY